MRISDRDTAHRAAQVRPSHEAAAPIALVRGVVRWYGRAFRLPSDAALGGRALVRHGDPRYAQAGAKDRPTSEDTLVRPRDARYDGLHARSVGSGDCALVPMIDARYDGCLGGFFATRGDCALVLASDARYYRFHVVTSHDKSSGSASVKSGDRRSQRQTKKMRIFRAFIANTLVLGDDARYDAAVESKTQKTMPRHDGFDRFDQPQQNCPGNARPGQTAEWAGVVRPGDIRYPGAHNPGPHGTSFTPCRFGGRRSRPVFQH